MFLSGSVSLSQKRPFHSISFIASSLGLFFRNSWSSDHRGATRVMRGLELKPLGPWSRQVKTVHCGRRRWEDKSTSHGLKFSLLLINP